MIRVKTCGITSVADAELCIEAGTDALGLAAEYPHPVPWNLSRELARDLADRFRGVVECVMISGGEAPRILALIEAVQPSSVQLHADETLETVAAVRNGLDGTGIPVVKAVRVPIGDTSPAEHWVGVARQFVDAGADRILLDSKSATKAAGTGVAVDWSVAAEIVAAVGVPVMLAGGLGPENVGAAIAQVRPWAVDAISSLEDDEHRKVPERVRAFVAAARAAG
ncbi:MAG: phosphoribosylanthranilate isomerase [Actinobacteria bacterium]|nr:phosphoribosylanthranilate isomerase [Actinomycetota bacterium]